MNKKNISWSIRIVVALLFLVSAIAKLYLSPYFAISTFEVKQLYTLGFSDTLAPYFSRILIGIEFALGFLMLSKHYLKRITIPATVGLLSVFIIHLSYVTFLSGGNSGNCGCFGELIPMTAEHEKAVFASQAFFKPTVDDLKLLDLKTLADVFQSLDQAEVTLAEIEAGYPIVDAFVKSGFLSSGNETRRALKENAVSVNKVKVTEEYVISTNDLIANTFGLLQKGKKNYYILKVV